MTTDNRVAERSAEALGWFSLGLGIAEMACPGMVTKAVGARAEERSRSTVRALGAREIVTGVGILTTRQTAGWMWARVAGDLMDLALLATPLLSKEEAPDRGRNAAALAAVAGITLIDLRTAVALRGSDDEWKGSVPVTRAITINRPRDEVYRFFRDLEGLPRFMAHLESVRELGSRSEWTAKAPAGRTVEWSATILEDEPDEQISWCSLQGADVPNRGSVFFDVAPGGRGTEVRVELEYCPPGGFVGAALGKLTGEEPGEQIDGDLRRFKQVLEAGEVVHSDASIHPGMHPARPPETRELGNRTVQMMEEYR